LAPILPLGTTVDVSFPQLARFAPHFFVLYQLFFFSLLGFISGRNKSPPSFFLSQRPHKPSNPNLKSLPFPC
jgi:hypothetical protein